MTSATRLRSFSSRPNAFTTRMPRTGSSIAVVTSARSLSSAQLSARSFGRNLLINQMLIGNAISDRMPMTGLRMVTTTATAMRIGAYPRSVGNTRNSVSMSWMSVSERVTSCPVATWSRRRRSADWMCV